MLFFPFTESDKAPHYKNECVYHKQVDFIRLLVFRECLLSHCIPLFHKVFLAETSSFSHATFHFICRAIAVEFFLINVVQILLYIILLSLPKMKESMIYCQRFFIYLFLLIYCQRGIDMRVTKSIFLGD